jgi:Helix-turn-helix domain
LIKGKRRGLSAEQKAELWNRWKAGQSLHEIGRALGKDHVVVHFVLARHGGIAPPARRRSRRVLTLAEREDISRGIASGCAMRVIARGLHRSASTISREITRHGGRTQYRANAADQQAWESAVRPKPCRLATHSELQQMVASRLMPDCRCDLHSRTASRSRRSRRSRSLGRRSVARGRQQSRGHAGGASFALLHVGEDNRQGLVYGGGRSEPARGPTPGGIASLADLGPRTGDGPTQNLHDGDGYAGLLLRSAESLAAGLKRKHKRPTAAIPAKERRPVQVLAIGAGRDRSATQYPATTNLGISNSGG